MPPAKYAKSQKFADLSSKERARRIAKIRDPKKRAAAQRFWGGRDDDGGGLFGGLVSLGKAPTEFAGNLVGDVPQLASALYTEAGRAAGAVEQDVRKGRGLPGATAFALGYPAWLVGRAIPGKGGTPKPKGPWAYQQLPKAEQRSATGRLAEEIVRGVPGQLKLLADPQEWWENPGIQILNLASIGLPAARVASVTRLSRSIQQANPGMPRAMANKAALVESFNPGFVRAQGLKGGIKPRVIQGQFGTAPGRMPSRQPTIRWVQSQLDKAAERVDVERPESRWSASAKAQRMNQRRAAAAVRQEKAGRKHLEDTVVAGLLGPGLTARVRSAFDRPGRTDRPRAAAVVAGLEAPIGMGVREAATLKIAALRNVLEENGDLAPMQENVNTLKRQREELQIEDPDASTADLDAEISKREGQLDVLMGRAVPELASPARTRVYRKMVDTIGENAANDQIKQWDLAAWGNDLENPTAFYDKVEVQRLADPEAFRPAAGAAGALFQRMAGEQGFHFPLRTALENQPNQPMASQQLRSYLTGQGVKAEELRNSGLEDVFAGVEAEGGGMFNTTQVLEHLEDTGYFQRYDPNVEVSTDAERGTFGSETRWGPEDSPYGPVLNSREGEPGEYFEFVIDYPDLPEEYYGAGEAHWRRPNVVYHVRGHVFWEDGVKKMLIEEIQSDWASDVRRVKSERKKLEASLEEAQAELAQATEQANAVLAEARKGGSMGGRLNEVRRQVTLAQTRVNQIKGDLRQTRVEGTLAEREAAREAAEEELLAAGEAYGEIETRRDELKDRIREQLDAGENPSELTDQLNSLIDEATDAQQRYRAAQDAIGDIERGGMPASPMHSERYVNNAIHQIMRKADTDEIDEIILVSGNTQALRNGRVNVDEVPSAEMTRRYFGAPGDERRYEYYEFYDWEDDRPMTNEEIDKGLGVIIDENDSFVRLYERDYPKQFKKLYGLDGEAFDDAYIGRFSAQPERGADPSLGGYYQEADGPMPGTVIQLTPEAKRKAREGRHALYQRKPGDGTPLGATEWLANGRRRVTMFRGANATTWSHELVHVLTPDLTPEHRAILEREIAGGKPYDEWTSVEHEKLANAWDTYWREGYAPPSLREVFADLIRRMKRLWKEAGTEAHTINRRTAEVFDQMLGKRYNNTVILNKREVGQVEADIADLQKAIDSGDVDQLDEATNALAELASQAEEAGAAILTRNKTPAQAAAILEGLAVRKNAVVEDYRRRGLLEDGDDAKGYFPHMSMWEALGQPPSDAVRMAATGDVVGTPRIQAKTVNRNRNRLHRFQTGEVLNDPVVVTYILRARLRLLETFRARNDLYLVGRPIEAGAPTMKDMVYVRNPEVQPERMRTATTAANRLAETDFRELSARQLSEEVDEVMNDVDAVTDEMVWDPRKDKARPAWVENEDNVRVVPRRVARNRLGDVFASAPRGNAMAAVGVTNALFRIASIYLRPWRYIPVNYTQNAIMLGLTNPAAFTKLVKRDVARLTKDDPQLRHLIRDQVGTIQATALPEFNTRPQTGLQRMERELTQASGQFGEMLGRYADVPIREAAWINHAGKYGFTTAEDVRRLIEDPDLEEIRDIVAQRTKEDLIDFDTLTPWEKEVATRWLALWPFIRGITKWPFMYAREYPARLAVASLASGAVNQEETDQTVMDMGIVQMFGRDINVGKLDPSAPGREMVQNAVALTRGLSKVAQGEAPDFTAFTGNYLTPGLREVLVGATGQQRSNWVKTVGRTFIPGVGIATDITKGGDLQDQALRQLGLVRERTDSVKREIKEWMNPIDKLTKQLRDAGREPPEALKQLQKLRAPYGDWKQYESEVKFSKRDRGLGDDLSEAERLTGLLDVAERYYPQLHQQAQAAAKGAGWASFEEMAESGKADEKWLEQVDRYLYDQMFGAMADIKRQAREAGLDVE